MAGFFVVAHLTKSLCEKLPSLLVHHGSCQLTFHISVFSITGESGCEFDQIVSWNFFNIICDIGESSFTCPWLWTNGLAWRLAIMFLVSGENYLFVFPKGHMLTLLSCESVHLGFIINIKTNFLDGHVRNIPTM
jgi:hypothetical protein